MTLRTRPHILLLFLVLVALASLAAALLPGTGAFQTRLAAAWPTLLVASLVAILATLALRIAAHAFQRQGAGRIARAARPLEGVIAFFAIAVAIAVVSGNAGSALVSLGLVGFGLTIALQRPLLAIAGWLAIHGARLFRVGDRIEIIGIAGDVLEVNLLTTRLWEIGTPSSPLPNGGAHTPQRPSGRIVTLSNATFLEHPVANATGDISHVFDEFSVTVAYESDVDLARRILLECAAGILDKDAHALAARDYRRLTAGMAIEANFPSQPVVIEALQDSWIELRLRYLVAARERGTTRTRLARAWLDATRPLSDKIPNVYPRVQPQNVGPDGRPRP